LLWAIKETGAEKVYVTHGFQSVLARYLTETGIEAAEVKTEYGSDEEESGNEQDQKTNEKPVKDNNL
jgi:putative mRNA 3-end processing factor